MIHKSPKTAAQFALDYDRHGDSYYDDATVESLKEVFKKIQEEVVKKLLWENLTLTCWSLAEQLLQWEM